MLSKWHENGVEAESLCLARVLKNIGLGRLAYEVNNGGEDYAHRIIIMHTHTHTHTQALHMMVLMYRI